MIMTAREIKIIRSLLNALHDLDGLQAGEITLHGAVNLLVPCGAQEFSEALKLAAEKKWINQVASRHTGKMKYNIVDAGEAARLEM